MDRRLEIARAARMAGVRREEIQRHIQAGRLTAFEGTVDLAELSSVYPQLARRDDAMLQRVARIKEAAVAKGVRTPRMSTEELVSALRDTEAEARRHRESVSAHRQVLKDLLGMLRNPDQVKGGAARLQAIADWLELKMKSLGRGR